MNEFSILNTPNHYAVWIAAGRAAEELLGWDRHYFCANSTHHSSNVLALIKHLNRRNIPMTKFYELFIPYFIEARLTT